MLKTILTPSAATLIDSKVDSVFDRLMVRLLGHAFTGKSLYITSDPNFSLPGIFAQAVTGEGGKIDTYLLNGVASIARDYLNKHREQAKASTKHTINSLLHAVNNGRIDPDDFENHVQSTMHELWDKVRSGVERVVTTENNNSAIMGTKDACDTIAGSMGIDDPTYVFICVHDSSLCDECRRLHLLPDGITPRAWRSSEISHEYHKKGGDSPSWGDLHPNGRCWPSLVVPGFGFDSSGRVTWVGQGHNELDYQRSFKRVPKGVDPRRNKLDKSEAVHEEPLTKFDIKWNDFARDLTRFGWTPDRKVGHAQWSNEGFPRTLPISHDFIGGTADMGDVLFKTRYLDKVGLMRDRKTGQIAINPKHEYARLYVNKGFSVPGLEPVAQTKTWTPPHAPEGVQNIPIDNLATGEAPQWSIDAHKKNFATGKGHAVPHVTAMDLGDGKLTVDNGSDVVEAARQAGMTHVPTLILKSEANI